jgi:hypothetical protein
LSRGRGRIGRLYHDGVIYENKRVIVGERYFERADIEIGSWLLPWLSNIPNALRGLFAFEIS